MKIKYLNRYGDDIIFEKLTENTIHMSGFNPEWIRYAYDNDYTQAHKEYLADCANMDEPDLRLLIEDITKNQVRPMTLEEFEIHHLHKDQDPYRLNNPFRKYYKLISSDESSICMVDPSGGPYIAKGTNLKYYFNSRDNMIVSGIKLNTDSVLLTIK